MLVLSRKKDEAIRIGDIVVMVVRIDQGKVRLGVDAPANVPVHREEIYQAVKRDGQKRPQPDNTAAQAREHVRLALMELDAMTDPSRNRNGETDCRHVHNAKTHLVKALRAMEAKP